MKRLLTILLIVVLASISPSAYAANTAAGSVPANITAIATDGTYNFLGTRNGKVYKQTVADSSISTTLVATLPEGISGLAISGTSLYITTNSGKIYYVSSASTGQTFTIVDGSVVSADILDNTIVNADVNSAANIDATKLATGLVTNTEFNYLDNVTSALQTQLDAKAPLAITVLDNVAAPSAAQAYGSLNVVDAAITVTLPTAVAGMSMCVVDVSGSADDVIIDVQAGDQIAILGAYDTAGDGITNASGSSVGDFACVVSPSANKWIVMERQGTWAQQ